MTIAVYRNVRIVMAPSRNLFIHTVLVRGAHAYASDGRNEAEQREKSEVSTNKSQEVKMI